MKFEIRQPRLIRRAFLGATLACASVFGLISLDHYATADRLMDPHATAVTGEEEVVIDPYAAYAERVKGSTALSGAGFCLMLNGISLIYGTMERAAEKLGGIEELEALATEE